jgi:hypothetical protein
MLLIGHHCGPIGELDLVTGAIVQDVEGTYHFRRHAGLVEDQVADA